MKNNKVSVIVPVYNAEKWLKFCVKSIIQQTYQNLEIILVDDGSTDKSPKICDKLKQKDERIEVFHRPNGGVSSARNYGLDHATGEYVCFVDSDDFLPSNAIEIMAEKMVEEKLDYCNGAGFCINPVHNVRFKEIREVETCRNEDEKWCFFLEQQEWAPWAKLFRRSIIENNHIRFPAGIRYGEDTLFVSEYLYYCNKVMTIDENLYYYNQLNQSSASKKFYPDLWKWSKRIVENFSRLIPPEYEKAGNEIYCYALKHYRMVNEFAVLHGSEDNKGAVVSLMQEAYLGFAEYLNEFAIEQVDDAVAQKVIDEYGDFVRRRDFEGLYCFLENKRSAGESAIKGSIRKICAKLKIACLRCGII